MRVLPLLLAGSLLTLAPAAHAKDVTETIRFTCLNVAVAEETLMSVTRSSSSPVVLPAGIKVWAADEESNSLVVTGEAAAVEQLKQIARLIDVTPRRVRLTLRSVQLDEAALAELKKDGVVSDGLTLVLVAGEAARKTLDQAPTLFSSTVRATNNRPVHLRLEGAPGEKPVSFSLLPRVNGDSTITLAIPRWDEVKGEKPQGEGRSSLLSVRRVASGQSILVSGAPFPAPLLIGVELLPEPAAPPAKP